MYFHNFTVSVPSTVHCRASKLTTKKLETNRHKKLGERSYRWWRQTADMHVLVQLMSMF